MTEENLMESGAGVVDNQGGSGDNGGTQSQESNTKEAAPEGATTGANLAGVADPNTPPVFIPNFKFKNQGKEHEIPEKYRTLIKDKESEKEVRDLFEKAYGIEITKKRAKSLQEERDDLKARFENTERGLETLSGFIQKKDYDSFFDALNIPKEEILRYALEYAQRTPEQQAAIAAERRRQQEVQEYDVGYRQLLTQNQELAVQMREFQLDQVMAKPAFAPVIEAYNAGMDNPNAFKEFVISIGQEYAHRGQDIPPEQAVQEATRRLQAVMPQQSGAPTQVQANPHNVVAPHTKPTLPNVQGSGKAPVKNQIRSVEDLRRIRDARM